MYCLRLFGANFSLSLRRSLAFRTNLVFEFFVSVTGIGAGLLALGLVFEQTSSLGGWTRGESIVLLGTFQIVSGLLWTFIEPNLGWFQNQITDGKLDDILLQPAPSLFMATLGTCSPLSLSQVITGAIVLGIGVNDLDHAVGGGDVLAWFALVAIGFTLTWAARVVLASLAFWAPGLSQDVMFGALWQFGRYPVSIYRQPIRFTLTFVLPLAFVATLPARALTRGVEPIVLAAAILVGPMAIALVSRMWHAGLRRYTSATS
jgi:ABC-2 type transport system permease protein